MRRLLPLLLVAAGLLLAGCGGSDDATTQAQVYFLRDGKVWPVARDVKGDDEAQWATDAVTQLYLGPTDSEKADLGASTALQDPPPSESTIEDATNGISVPGDPSTEALAQLVYTLTQFDPGQSVAVNGKSYTRADFEDQTPAILVESPLPFAEVTSPLTAGGTANTFEATFNYEVYDADGNVVDENFVTATSGTGTRGTFHFTTGDFDSISKLVVFEPSAEDGSKTKLVEIPLTSS